MDNVQAECRFRLRSLSVGSEVFSESESILDSSNHALSLSQHDVDVGIQVGKGGFSEIIEVKKLKKGRSNSLSTEMTLTSLQESTKDEEGGDEDESSISFERQDSEKDVVRGSRSDSLDSNPEKTFVIKTIRKDLPLKDEACGRVDLAIEAQFLKTLEHPNIVSLHGVGENPGERSFFIVLERIDRTLEVELDTWLICQQRMKSSMMNDLMPKKMYKENVQDFLNHRIAVALQLASAISYLHEKNILFRDLKPGNIGLDFKNTVKLFDFGLAKELKSVDKVDDDKYHASIRTGTRRYMAPEVFLSSTYGLSADVYSFSLILWEIMSLEIPYAKLNAEEHALQTFKLKRRPKVRQYKWPNEIKDLIKQGWRHNSAARPKICDVYEDLAEFLESQKWTVDESKVPMPPPELPMSC